MNAFSIKTMVVTTLLGLALAVGCSAADEQPQPVDMISITTTVPASPKSAIPISVCEGCQFSITLPSNPTTGYMWRLNNQPDITIVKHIDNVYNAPKVTMPGAGGEEVWTFQGLKKGTAQIVLEYARPWEKDVPPIKSQGFIVTVL